MFIGYLSERMRKLSERVNREDNENKTKVKDKGFALAAVIRDGEYNFEEYANLADFGNNFFNRKLLLEEAINEQNLLLSLINQLELSLTKEKKGRPISKDNKEKITVVTKNLKKVYETKKLIFEEFENSEGKEEKQRYMDKKKSRI